MARRKPELHSSKAALAEQFDDLEQQHEASSLGMWVFLATEVMFFGGLFTAYIIYRNAYLPAFEAGSRLLDVRIGAFNTAVLLCSSLTMALACALRKWGKKERWSPVLMLTLLLGLVFVGVKLVFEWRHDYLEGFCARRELDFPAGRTGGTSNCSSVSISSSPDSTRCTW